MTRELLTPVLDGHLLVTRGLVPVGLEPGQAPAGYAAAARGAGRGGTAVVGRARSAPARRGSADHRVVGVEHVDEGLGGKRGMER